jgi:hypothetical protein
MSAALPAAVAGCRKWNAERAAGAGRLSVRSWIIDVQAAKPTVRHISAVKPRCFVYSDVIARQRNAFTADSTDFPAILSKRNSFRQLTKLAFFFRAPGAMATAQAPPKLATIRLYAAAARYARRRLF